MSETRTVMNGKPVFEVPGKTVINFESGFAKKKLCTGPVFNAGQACVYSCAFCYVPAMQLKAQAWMKKHGVNYPEEGHLGVAIRNKDAVARVREQLLAHPEFERNTFQVIYSSTKVDVAGNMDLVRETVEICKVILELTNWDIRLLSKSNLLPKVAQALDSWYGITDGGLKRSRVIYGVSTGTLDDRLASAFEEGTPKVSKRIESLHWLQDNGFRTFGMICPSLPSIEPAGYTPFAKEMYAAIRGDKCEHVWAEVINVRGESFTRTEKCLNEAGFTDHARVLKLVSENKDAWESYARHTFEAHARLYKPGQLRFLQYVTNKTRPYWESQQNNGAVLL